MKLLIYSYSKALPLPHRAFTHVNPGIRYLRMNDKSLALDYFAMRHSIRIQARQYDWNQRSYSGILRTQRRVCSMYEPAAILMSQIESNQNAFCANGVLSMSVNYLVVYSVIIYISSMNSNNFLGHATRESHQPIQPTRNHRPRKIQPRFHFISFHTV